MKTNFYSLIREIEKAGPQSITNRTGNNGFELRPEKWLLEDLSGNYGALFIRAILNKLNVDESYVLKWRLENKYQQYKVLNYYVPKCMPATIPLSQYLNQRNGVESIKNLFKDGYFLKATLGDASYVTQSWDKTDEFEEIVAVCKSITDEGYEDYMLQKKIDIRTEFRVHTFSSRIIPYLTYVAHGENVNSFPEGAEDFLSNVLSKLPRSIIEGSIIAWDVALSIDNKYYIIEANFTGFHPIYRRGFQTTGYVDDHKFGPIICAWLNLYFYKYFGVYLDSIHSALTVNYPFFRHMLYYMSIFKIEHLNLIQNTAINKPFTLVLYLGDDSNILMINLIKHFILIAFAMNYIIVIKDDYISKIYSLFNNYHSIQFCAESWLFTKEQFEVIKLMSYERRKCICCNQVARRNNSACIL